MTRQKVLSSALLLSTPFGLPAQAALTTVVPTLTKARGLYYTPVDQGLRGFQCEVTFDWKSFMQKASNQAVPDDDSRLRYLQGIHLTVDDNVRSGGLLHWSAPTPPPDSTEESVARIREGLQQVWSGFLQSWNGFMTGDLMTIDSKATVDHSSVGYHVAVRTGTGLAEEQFTDALILQSIHVTTPGLESTITPQFVSGPEGLLVSTIDSSERQPPSASPTEVKMVVKYATVGRFQLPSELRVAVGPAEFDYRLTNCTVQSQITPR